MTRLSAISFTTCSVHAESTEGKDCQHFAAHDEVNIILSWTGNDQQSSTQSPETSRSGEWHEQLASNSSCWEAGELSTDFLHHGIASKVMSAQCHLWAWIVPRSSRQKLSSHPKWQPAWSEPVKSSFKVFSHSCALCKSLHLSFTRLFCRPRRWQGWQLEDQLWAP